MTTTNPRKRCALSDDGDPLRNFELICNFAEALAHEPGISEALAKAGRGFVFVIKDQEYRIRKLEGRPI